jgi:hypothetical protein
MAKEGYEPLTSIQSSDVEDAKQYAQASQTQCCKVKRCRVVRVLGLIALAAASFVLTGMIFGPRHHHHPWGPHPWGPHHGPHGPGGPHGGPDDFDDPREAAMSMAAFELEAAAGPMVWDRRRVFSVVKGESTHGCAAVVEPWNRRLLCSCSIHPSKSSLHNVILPLRALPSLASLCTAALPA